MLRQTRGWLVRSSGECPHQPRLNREWTHAATPCDLLPPTLTTLPQPESAPDSWPWALSQRVARGWTRTADTSSQRRAVSRRRQTAAHAPTNAPTQPPTASTSTALASSIGEHGGRVIAGFAKVGPPSVCHSTRLSGRKQYPLSHTDAHIPEFWNNRLASTDPPLEASQTKVPLIPDQTEFLERWFEFHQGYRIVKRPDGSESRRAVIGEPFAEVSPGFLPRTLDQLRAGCENDERRAENRFRRRRLSSEEERAQPEEPHQTIEEALDSLLEEVSDEELITEDDLIEATETELNPDMSQERTDLSTPRSRTEVRLQRTRDRFVRLFGSREDVERDDYESPLSTMYNRAYNHYRQAEARRETGDVIAPPLDGLSQHDRREIENQVLWGVLNESRASEQPQVEHVESLVSVHAQTREDSSIEPISFPPFPTQVGTSRHISSPTTPPESTPETMRTTLSTLTADLMRLRQETQTVNSRYTALLRRPPSPLIGNLDQPNRPPPLTDEEMTKDLSCQVCYSQLADIAVLPCGHMVMCEWCADVVVPVRHGYVPVVPTKCPMCRKGVKSRVRIHVG